MIHERLDAEHVLRESGDDVGGDPRRAEAGGDVGGLQVLGQGLFEGCDIAPIAFVQARGGDRRGELGADFAREIGVGRHPDVPVVGEGRFRIEKDALAEFRDRCLAGTAQKFGNAVEIDATGLVQGDSERVLGGLDQRRGFRMQHALPEELGNSSTPDSGFSGPFRGELGDASEGSNRTFAFIRWPGHVSPDTSSYAMFPEMDFLPTLAGLIGGRLPADRPFDGIDQSDVLIGESATGHREQLLTFIGPDLVAVRWKQWRVYYRDIRPVGEGAERLGGLEAASSDMNGYPKIFNIEMDPGEQLNVAFLFPWVLDPALKAVLAYERSVKERPNPPAPHVTRFRGGG